MNANKIALILTFFAVSAAAVILIPQLMTGNQVNPAPSSMTEEEYRLRELEAQEKWDTLHERHQELYREITKVELRMKDSKTPGEVAYAQREIEKLTQDREDISKIMDRVSLIMIRSGAMKYGVDKPVLPQYQDPGLDKIDIKSL